nr:protocadherin alpha 6 [Hymenolepis microstoma]
MIFLKKPYGTLGQNIPYLKSTDTAEYNEISLYVSENAASGTIVGVLREHLPFLKSGTNLRYQIYNLGSVPDSSGHIVSSNSANDSDSIFQIDPITSTITVLDSRSLDRENLCPFASGTEKECSLNYGVAVSRSDKSTTPLSPEQSWIKVKIVINDINDCAPRFNNDSSESYKVIDLPEDTPVGTKVPLPDAIDLDSSQNGQLIYHLNCENEQNNHPFGLHQSRKLGVSKEESPETSLIRLQLRYPLDYEGQKSYNCTLGVCDNGTPMHCSTLPLLISVHDVNDNAPVFQNENASFVLPEDTPVGTRVTKLNATDVDSGAFGSIRFAFVGDFPDSMSSQRHFRLDPNTGEIFLTSPLQGGTKFNFWVEARDRGEPESRMSRSTISIYVIDVNNHAPKISVLPASSKIKYGSRQTVKSVLSKVSKVSCNFAGVKATKVCSDTDEEASLIQVFEDNMAPSNIAFIQVTDADVGENAQVDCQLHVRPEIPFGESIKLVPGQQISSSKIVYKLVLETMLDCEIHSRDKYTSICNSGWSIPVKIECRDFGTPVKKSYHSIFVEIIDNNEFPPVFDKEVYRAETKESATLGSNIVQVSVTDPDSIMQGVPKNKWNNFKYLPIQQNRQILRFELVSKEDLPFAVDSLSGRIYVSGVLDAENKTEYNFRVKAINTGMDNVTLTSTCQVIIIVQNVNDNPPHFLPPRVLVGSLVTDEQGTTVRIPENIHKGTVFMQLRTTDPDGDDDTKVRLEACYPRINGASITQSNLSKAIKPIFEVESESGKCWTTGILDRENIPAYLCSVVAEDGDTESGLSLTTTLTIELVDENDNAPIWLYPRAPDDSRIQIGVEFPASRIITRVRAIDADSGKNSRIVYTLEDASFVHFNHEPLCDLPALFSLESMSGHLRMRDGIRSCVRPGDSVRLLLRATDEGIPSQSKDAEFFIEFILGSEVLNIPPESTFLTQADEAFGNKPPNSELQIREFSPHTDVINSMTTDGSIDSGNKRMHVFVLMIVVPLAAILLCCCLVTTLLFIIRSKRRQHPRQIGFKDTGSMSELNVDTERNLFSPTDGYQSSQTRSPTPSTSQIIYTSDVKSISSMQRIRPGSSHEFELAKMDDTLPLDSGDIQMQGKVIYPIYLKPLTREASPVPTAGNPVIRLTSIPELEGTILVPVSHGNIPCSNATPALDNQQSPETGILMACMSPDADKSSADSGKGQSDEDVFNHEGVQRQCLQSSSFIYVPVCSADFGQTTHPARSLTSVPIHASVFLDQRFESSMDEPKAIEIQCGV